MHVREYTFNDSPDCVHSLKRFVYPWSILVHHVDLESREEDVSATLQVELELPTKRKMYIGTIKYSTSSVCVHGI